MQLKKKSCVHALCVLKCRCFGIFKMEEGKRQRKGKGEGRDRGGEGKGAGGLNGK